jgi:hypothetical protein
LAAANTAAPPPEDASEDDPPDADVEPLLALLVDPQAASAATSPAAQHATRARTIHVLIISLSSSFM